VGPGGQEKKQRKKEKKRGRRWAAGLLGPARMGSLLYLLR
jgi:hypothetical protein